MALLRSVELLLAIQRIATPSLDLLMRGLSFLGDEVFYFAVLVFLYWRVKRQLAVRLAVVVLSSLYVSFLLKEFFQIPRPMGEGLRVLEVPEDFSFPSGHAQSVTSFWFFLALSLRKSFLFILAGVLVFLVSFSRLYLGVHYLGDVLCGAALGLFLAWVFSSLFRGLSSKRVSSLSASFLLGFLSLVLFLFAPSPLGVKVAGSLSGVLFGYLLVTSMGLGEESFSLREYVWGVGILVLLYLGGKSADIDGEWWLFTRYFLLNLYATFGFPLLARVLRKRRRVPGEGK